MLRSGSVRAQLPKGQKVSRDACLWSALVGSERWTGSGFKLSRRNDAGGEGSTKQERSAGVCDSSEPVVPAVRTEHPML